MTSAVQLYQFLRRRKSYFFFVVLLITALCAYLSSRVKLEEDISRFLPKGEGMDKINFALQNLKIKDKLIIHISLADSTKDAEPEALMAAAEQFHDSLTHSFGLDYIKDMTWKVSDDLMLRVYSTFYSNLPLFLDEKDYLQLESKLPADSLRQVLKSDYKTMITPSGFALARFIPNDPMGITWMALKKMRGLQFDENYEMNEGFIMTKDHKHLLLFITPAVQSSETRKANELIKGIEAVCHKVNALSRNKVAVEYYGALAVSAGNGNQIKRDSLFTTGIALTLIVLVLSLFFRNKLTIFFILLPVVFGAVFSLAILYLLKEQVSAIALGAGSVILGIAINYSMHFFTHFKRENSVEHVIRDLTLPMLIGCTTTVGAFISLMFVKSEALHDFGLFAGFSLIGAVLFTIIVLPHLLRLSFGRKHDEEVIQEELNFIEKLVRYRLDKNRLVLFITLVLTIVFSYTAGNVSFESDMNKMNYQDAALSAAQRHLDEINNFSQRSVYLISKGKDLNEALRHSEVAQAKLEELKTKGIVKKYFSVSNLLFSDSLQQARINRWNQFWTESRRDTLHNRLVREGRNFKFREDAFRSFYQLLGTRFSPGNLNVKQLDSLKQLVLNEWVTEKPGLATVVTMIKADTKDNHFIYEAFDGKPGLIVFDRQYMTNQFVNVISSDFTLILVMTSLLVLGFMLLSHGRIELTLINFLPMFISWIWILGIMGIFGLKFNIINIIISTFIFGLGDDYSIFIMDGLQNEYKYGRKNLDSYKTSIFLSALTTIIGIGVLIFAKHPALRSIAAITIIGMFAVLFVSFVTQPLLYNFMILNRARQKRLPYTAVNLLITIAGFMAFAVGSFLVTLTGFVLFYLVPMPVKRKKVLYHRVVRLACKGLLYCFINVRKTVINEHGEDFKKPAIIISNHQSHIDLGMTLMLNPKIIVFTSDWVWNSPFFGQVAKFADFYPASAGYENGIDKIRALVNDGYSVLIFPEGTRSTDNEIHRFHKGAFKLAQDLGIDILPVVIHGTGNICPKGDFYFNDGVLTLKVMKRIAPGDTRYGQTYQERTKEICRAMREEFAGMKKQIETVHYFRSRMIRNYVYKGPLIEWYCRVKTGMEKNYELFDQLLPAKGLITDVGCGYGFLSYMLSFRSKEREILGVDYDEEKIELASACVSRTDTMNFVCADVSQYDFPESDAFVISDVLHYLEEEPQLELVRKCISKLKPGGVIVLRDADKGMSERHKGTKYTEFFSTKVVGFNKTQKNGLHFIPAKKIEEMLGSMEKITFELIDNTRFTSNVIFVIRKSM